MNKTDLISLHMDIHYGQGYCRKLKSLVNEALDNGEYIEGFEVAIKKGDLDDQECRELLQIVHEHYPIDLDFEKLDFLIEEHLPQSEVSTISWLVSDNGSLIVTDTLRVAKFTNGELAWVTKRISWDGINLFHLSNDEIVGEWYNPTSADDFWSPLRISSSSGRLIQGEEIDF